ncbi:MAG TPA: PAS domain S-box protein [Burkholderiaceae bacterium]|nr:PAS domain S-box protein [Burkholderiaceae bacterium]
MPAMPPLPSCTEPDHFAQALLRDSEACLRAIFDAAEDSIFVHDWDSGAVLDVNTKACETCGYRHDELCGLSLADLCSGVPPYTKDDALRRLARARQGDCPPFEWQRRNKDGSLHWDEVRLKRVMLRGRPHILAFARDITERRQAEEALRAREAQYRVVFNGSADALVLWDSNVRVVDVNPAFTQMYGYPREEILGQALDTRIGGSAGVEERRRRIRLALAGEEQHVEIDARRKNGECFEVELRYLPVVYRNEPHVLAVARDITDRRERERALQRSEARLRATVEAALDSVVGMDSEGRILEFNGAAERCFGYRREDVLGRSLAEVIIPECSRAAHEGGLKRFLAMGHGPYLGQIVETTAMRADGSEFPVELAISVGQAPEGNIFVGHLRDITARREADARRNELEAQLRQAQKMEAIGQLTGGIAHDFNNILTSAIGYVVLAMERAQGLGDARLVRQLEQAHIATQRGRDLVAQMLAFARRQRTERRMIALAPVVRQAVQLLRSTLPSTIEIDNLQLDSALAEAAPQVQADPVQLEQVLFNLCINARDAIEGTGRIGVQLREAQPGTWHCASCRKRIDGGAWVALSVADDGCGMTAEVLERIFDPFYSTKEVGRGSGMGLAMVHGIVHDHAGHVHVTTCPSAGSTFTVMLPAFRSAADVTHPHPQQAVKPAMTQLRGRVMVVEDQLMVGDYMAELLEGWGLDVVLQRDPRTAVQWLANPEHAVDVLITDQTMPGITGIELAQRVARLRSGLPVILCTANSTDVDAAALHSSGIHALLGKPIVPETLKALLSRLLQQQA